jgi:DNA-binding transcriptional LysR family regulator
MPADRSTHLARLVERLGADVTLTDARERRIDRARRVQDAWLRGLRGAAGAGRPQPPPPSSRDR